jgi:hypothetical protein
MSAEGFPAGVLPGAQKDIRRDRRKTQLHTAPFFFTYIVLIVFHRFLD